MIRPTRSGHVSTPPARTAGGSTVHLLKAAKLIEADGNERSVAFDLSNVELIRDALARLPGCKLVIVDPIGSYLGGRVDAHRDNEVRSVLAPLAALASERNVAVVLICHTRKSGAAGSGGEWQRIPDLRRKRQRSGKLCHSV
ncbi:MAG: hypothetical protein FJ297_04445 [Planctomycetes bacterium]|nr:hypothetical protein [Planctomycetota bacterium]